MDLPLLRLHQIEAMLQFAGREEQPSIHTLYLPIEDGILITKVMLQRGIDFILTHHQQGKKVLVACGAGISRSVTFTIAALKETEGLTLLEAYETVLKAHRGALPHPVLWKSLGAYYQEDTLYWLLLKKYNRCA